MQKYWIYTIKHDNWPNLTRYYAHINYSIFSHALCDKLKEDDIIFIYQKHPSHLKSGFVALGKIGDKMELNEDIKIFNDANLQKYYANFKEVYMFSEILPITKFEKTIKSTLAKTLDVFKKQYLDPKNVHRIVDMTNEMGKVLEKELLGYDYKKLKSEYTGEDSDVVPAESKEDLFSECESSHSEKSDETKNESQPVSKCKKDLFSDADSDSDDETDEKTKESNDETKKKDLFSDCDDTDESASDDASSSSEENEGTEDVPILMTPCKKFKWSDDDDEIITELITHYNTCKKCDKVDNNTVVPALDDSKILYNELDDEDDINKYMECYFNVQKYEKKRKDVSYVYKINDTDHDYYGSIIILP